MSQSSCRGVPGGSPPLSPELVMSTNPGSTTGTAHPTSTSVWVPVPIPAQVPVQEGMVEVSGSRLYYWDTGGSGHPMILLHAGTQSAAGWPYQQPVLAQAG